MHGSPNEQPRWDVVVADGQHRIRSQSSAMNRRAVQTRQELPHPRRRHFFESIREILVKF
jgi:hypothetical protein